MDEPPVVNGRVSSRELYTAISSLREELGSAQRAQAADVMAAVAATEHHLSTRIDRLEATVSGHDDLIQQLRRRGAWSRSSSASRSSRPRSAS